MLSFTFEGIMPPIKLSASSPACQTGDLRLVAEVSMELKSDVLKVGYMTSAKLTQCVHMQGICQRIQND